MPCAKRPRAVRSVVHALPCGLRASYRAVGDEGFLLCFSFSPLEDLMSLCTSLEHSPTHPLCSACGNDAIDALGSTAVVTSAVITYGNLACTGSALHREHVSDTGMYIGLPSLRNSITARTFFFWAPAGNTEDMSERAHAGR
jgi:hypothetical protein